MSEILAIMCERCAGDELNGKPQKIYVFKTSCVMLLEFWGCPHLSVVAKEIPSE